jgi:AAA domain/RepB DNA-primase from phage plasmid
MATAYDLCSLAWSDKKGYVCLAVRDPSIDKHTKGYWVDYSFKWPADSDKIHALLNKSKESKKDVYWAPAVFDQPTRTRNAVSTADLLWADLDNVDPRGLPDNLKPTAAWQSSPGRYQAVWRLDRSVKVDIQQRLNQRLTYALGADKGGWDLTQVLRTPGTPNHKYPEHPKVKMLWMNGRKLNPTKLLNELPELDVAEVDTKVVENIPSQSAILKRYKIPTRAKQLIKARFAQQGTRSDRLWELECLLAEANMTEEEIVGVVMPTVWNKFKGRHDELTRLSVEARKAIQHSSPDEETIVEEIDDDDEERGPSTWSEFDRDHQPIRWMVADIWGTGEVGFISGHPKSYKSWLALDLAVSVATGTRFLGSFQARRLNVLLIQEEDPKPILQERLSLVAANKGLVGVEAYHDGSFDMQYELPDNLYIISNQGFTINDEWLELLEQWINEKKIELLILDPLMMIGENFDEFKAFEVMSKVLKPLKRLRSKTDVAIAVVHHHTKGTTETGAKAMYGSVAMWAWEEAALHLSVTSPSTLLAERFSKHAILSPVNIELGDLSERWSPQVTQMRPSNLYDALVTMEGGATVDQLVAYTQMGRESIDRALKRMEKEGKVKQAGKRRAGPGRPSTVWTVNDD